MNDTTALDELHDRLKAWAQGSLPLMAAVAFLIHTGTLYLNHPMICDDGERAWLDVFNLEPGEWAGRVGHMSGGERATWESARSMVDGELDRWFWRLDQHRQSAFLAGLLAR